MSNPIVKFFEKYSYKIFSSKTKRVLSRINAIEKRYQEELSDADLPKKTAEFIARIKRGEPLDSLLPEAYALVKNAARRMCGKTYEVLGRPAKWDMVHYDVQIIGAIALQKNMVAEIATGEGKTLAATMPAYLNALAGRGCHIATVNEYLARRDSEWMGALYSTLGLSCACALSGQSAAEKRAAYLADITYSTASELGFDYLRDNSMAYSSEEQVQRGFYFCIVDEADSVLIDEARTPLVISGPDDGEDNSVFRELLPCVEKLVSMQTRLCSALARDAEAAVNSGKIDSSVLESLWLVKKGTPRNRVLRRIMESGRLGKKFSDFETFMCADFQKNAAYALREKLYYWVDEKSLASDLTEKGRKFLSAGGSYAFVLPDIGKILSEIAAQDIPAREKIKAELAARAAYKKSVEKIRALRELLNAYSVCERDVEYIVRGGKVEIIDKNTGRVMEGRRWSGGLHQAVEAKERAQILEEDKTYATISIQNYFRMYERLAGMTGTAESRTGEFSEIYKLNPVKIPTNRPCRRVEYPDLVFATKREKFLAVANIVKDAHGKGRPVLVGTASVDDSQVLSKILKISQIPHSVLNAKNNALEAEIVARAGEKYAVTISTNMAGRGTDIKLGEGAEELGGLLVVGTERHESERIDRQLAGRCARQGDSGGAVFAVSLEDKLLRVYADTSFAAKALKKKRVEGGAFSHPIFKRVIERAQAACEAESFASRKYLLGFDDASNRQREIIYQTRNSALEKSFSFSNIDAVLRDAVMSACAAASEGETFGAQSAKSAEKNILEFLPLNFDFGTLVGKTPAEASREISDSALCVLNQKRGLFGEKDSLEIERRIFLEAVDKNWQEHLWRLECMQDYIYLRGYEQKDPVSEFKIEAFKSFRELLTSINEDVCRSLFDVPEDFYEAAAEAEASKSARLKKRAKISR